MIGQPLTKQFEQFFEEEGRSDYGWPGIVPEAVALEHLGPTTELLAPVDQRDAVALGPQAQGGGNAAVARAHDHGMGHFSHPARC